MATIRFDANVPVECALKYDSGKQVKSRIENAPDQMMYTICGDDTIYVPLHVAADIAQQGIRKLELISICKRQQNGVTRWEVKRVGDTATTAIAPAFNALPTAIDASPLERQLTDSINQVRQREASTPSKSAPPAAIASAPHPTGATQRDAAPHANSNSRPISHSLISKLMAQSLIAAIDAIREAERYAHAQGIDFEFQSEDVRAVSNTIFIALSKDPNFGKPAQVNGGAQPWQH
jgi:hypothetical protein